MLNRAIVEFYFDDVDANTVVNLVGEAIPTLFKGKVDRYGFMLTKRFPIRLAPVCRGEFVPSGTRTQLHCKVFTPYLRASQIFSVAFLSTVAYVLHSVGLSVGLVLIVTAIAIGLAVRNDFALRTESRVLAQTVREYLEASGLSVTSLEQTT